MDERAFEWDFSSRQSEILAEVVTRLTALRPRLIVLFGSRATNTARNDSDYDLLIVVDAPDRSQRTIGVRRLLRGLGVPFDVVVYSPEEWEAWRTHPQSLAFQIARDGRVLLDAAA